MQPLRRRRLSHFRTIFFSALFSVVGLAVTAFVGPIGGAEAVALERPNIVFLLCDNLGYGDVGCYGSTLHRTPHIDQMAREGMRLTNFYSASGVCTPSRASLMTGCYPRRVGLDRTDPDGHVLRPLSPNGLHPDEITIAEALKSRGYATACIGKWHLGDHPSMLPTRQGFDQFFGIPYSDDMTARPGKSWPPLPLMRGERTIEAPVDRDLLTKRYTEAAIEFMDANRERPFFLYLPHAMPGSTAHPFSSHAFRGKSANGDYGDSVEELDWSTGEILRAIQQLGLDNKTLVVWTSDNGAPRRNPPQGSNAPLGGWGYTTREGGMRVPCVVRWPERIPAESVCHELTTMMDWLPTFAHLAGASAPRDRKLDGHDITPLLMGESDAKSPYEAFYYYHTDQLQAVRDHRWKLAVAGGDATAESPYLFDLSEDLAEAKNVAEAHPEVVSRLSAHLERAREDLGDQDRKGEHVRPVGRADWE